MPAAHRAPMPAFDCKLLLPFAALLLAAVPAVAQQVRVQAEVRVVPMRPAQPQQLDVWQVGKASTRTCIDVGAIAAAVMVDPGTVDIVLKGGKRWRLLLAQQCHQLSYYGGIYYQPVKAGQFCAGKDRILSRAGGACRVQAIAPMRQVKTKVKR